MKAAAAPQRTTKDGLVISASHIHRLEKELKFAKDAYDSLTINQLVKAGTQEDQAQAKKQEQELNDLKKKIRHTENLILEIRLALKDMDWNSSGTRYAIAFIDEQPS